MAQVIEIDFAKEVDNMGDGEQTEQDKTQVFGTWAKAATGDFLSEVQAADASMYSNMIVGSGDADYTNILNSLPSGRQSSIMGSSSVYFRHVWLKELVVMLHIIIIKLIVKLTVVLSLLQETLGNLLLLFLLYMKELYLSLKMNYSLM